MGNSDWSGPKNGSDDREQGPDGGVTGMDPGGVIESNWDKVCDSFDEMNLKEKLLRGIYAYGFERPSAIQQRAILPCKLEQGVHVVVGTPGRVFDMINRRALHTDKIRIFVLDEADEMLSRGFKDQIYDVFKNLPAQVQV